MKEPSPPQSPDKPEPTDSTEEAQGPSRPPPASAPTSSRQRLRQGLRSATRRGREELTRPGGLGEEAQLLFFGWLYKVWKLRGGGLYALGFATTFLYLEITELFFEDIPQFLTLESYDAGSLLRFAIEFIVDTFINTVNAFIWPAFVVGWQPPLGIIALVAAFILFPRYLKGPIEDWLFRNAPYEDDEGEGEEKEGCGQQGQEKAPRDRSSRDTDDHH